MEELLQKLSQLEQKIEFLQKENEELKTRLKKLERKVEDLEADLDLVYETSENLR